MLPEIDEKFVQIKQKYGENSLERVEAMMVARPNQRETFQKDAKWVLPGLSATPWLEVNQFSGLNELVLALENNCELIRQEIQNVLSYHPSKLTPYVHYLQTLDNWKALYLYKDGAPVEDQGAFPVTKSILNNELKDWLCPLLEMHFSILEPGAVISPHCDLWNFSINLHLAIDIPTGCGIKVANEARAWKPGKCLLFDYSFQHEAWNNSTKNRVCLLMDIWHPDLSEAERLALTFFIREIRKYL